MGFLNPMKQGYPCFDFLSYSESKAHEQEYPAITKDLYARKIVGYAFSDCIDTQLTLAVLDMAYRHRPGKGLIFHSDRGVQ